MALSKVAKRNKPLFINVRTIIGVGSAVADKAVSHGAPLGVENVAEMKKAYGWDPEKHFVIPDSVREFYAELPKRGEKYVQGWNSLVEAYSKEHPDLAKEVSYISDVLQFLDWHTYD